MHIPDGFIDVPVAVAAAGVTVAGVAICLRGARHTLDDRTAPLAGLVAVFVFAGQMLNFPVGAGTSGHLIGAALATILVGPYAGALAITVVLMVQALFFADGGLLALGLNVTNMALIGALVAWPVFRGLYRVLGDGRSSLVVASWAAGLLAVLGAVAGFMVEFRLGGTEAIDPQSVAVAMFGVHAVIGAIEGVITALVVSAVVAVRPDLVVGLSGLRRNPTDADLRVAVR